MSTKSKDQLPGGFADKSDPTDFDKKQLQMGVKVEMEHTNDPKKAKEIAMDHLKEIPDYYTRLKRMEQEAKKSLDDVICDFQKATIHHKNTDTYTDSMSTDLAKLANPESYQAHIQGYVKDLGIGETVEIPLRDSKVLKIYKVEDGVYSGDIRDEDGTITHNIDRVTVPEIISHLASKEAPPVVESEDKEEEKETKQIIININVSKSKESGMDLGSKIDQFYKSNEADKNKEKESGSESTKEEPKMTTQDEEQDEELKKKEGRTKLVSHMIDTLKDHHGSGHSDNVKDISKFIVHLHKDEQKPGDKKVKKSLDESINDLSKSYKEVKLTNEENKELFDIELKNIIENTYFYCKRNHPEYTDEQRTAKLKTKVKENVIRRMSYDDKFLIAKRAAKFNDKLLSSTINSVDFKELDRKFEAMYSNNAEVMMYSKEGREKYKVFGMSNKGNPQVLDALEKGSNFFNTDIKTPEPLIKSLKELDYETLSKKPIRKRTDEMIKSNVDAKIRD